MASAQESGSAKGHSEKNKTTGRPALARSFLSARTPAITTRLIFASALALTAFLTLTGWALDQAFERSAVKAIQLRLQGYFYSLLQESDVNVKGKLLLSDRMPQADFDRPASGLYAGVRGPDFYWLSPSALGREMPFTETLTPGEFSFNGPVATEAIGNMYVYSVGVTFENNVPSKDATAAPAPTFTFYVAETDGTVLAAAKSSFSQHFNPLFGWFWGVFADCSGIIAALELKSLAPRRQRVSRGRARHR